MLLGYLGAYEIFITPHISKLYITYQPITADCFGENLPSKLCAQPHELRYAQ